MEFKKVFSNKLLIITTIIYLVIGSSLYYIIPNQLNKNNINQTKQEGEALLDTLIKTREFYNNHIVKNIIASATNIHFTHIPNKKTELPYPSSFLHLLGKQLSNNTIEPQLYSNFPFKQHIGRILTNKQIQVLKAIEQNPKNTYISMEKINDKKFITIAKADFITSKTCLSCHNNNADKNNNIDWLVGDLRGVIEIIIPVKPNDTIGTIKLSIIIIISLLLFLTFLYGVFNTNQIQKALEEQTTLQLKFNKSFKLLNDKNKDLEHNLDTIFEKYDKYVIYSKTNLFGIITEVSSAFCNISGYTKEELIGKPHNIIRHPDMPKEAFEDMWKTIQSGTIWTGEVKNHTKDGGFYWVKSIVAPICDEDKVVVGYSSFRTDITQEKINMYGELDRRGDDRRDPTNRDRRFKGPDQRNPLNDRRRDTD